jgi:gluconolactonase
MLFAPPQIVETTVFASLPDELKLRPDEINEWARGQPLGIPTRSLLEGPSFDRDGTLYCVDVVTGRVYTVSSSGEFNIVAEYDGWPNGLKIHKDGRIFIADYKNGIMLLDPVNGKVTPYLERANLERFKAVNDLFFGANGDLYFTDQGLTGLHDPSGRVFRASSDGRVTCLIDNVPSPNGLVMNLDETALYVAVTRGNCVWRLPFTHDGNVTKVGVQVQLSGGNGPDGLALDENGGLLVAHVGFGAVWVTDARCEPQYRVNTCMGQHTTNIAFGWPDRNVLYITESGSGTILKATLDTPGKPMYSHQ